MFYSHEILTSRKHGIATVWLVATLGSKSNLKKINRKAIFEVNVPKACEAIRTPGAPMALRLQGSLLYGISRVFLQQCGYVLADAQSAQSSMRMVLNIVKKSELDPEAGKARSDQLILEDDPSFLPDFALPPLDLNLTFDLPDLDLPMPDESQLTSLDPLSSQRHSPHGGPVGGIIIPDTDSPAGADMGGFMIQGEDGHGTPGFGTLLGGDEEGGDFEDLGFGFDAEGNIFDTTVGPATGGTPATGGAAALGSDTAASARVRREHEEGRQAGDQPPDDNMDLDFPIIDDILPEGEAFPIGDQAGSGEHTSPTQQEESETSPAAAAPMRRRRRGPKIIPLDDTMELRNGDISDWNTNYLSNMDEAARAKEQHRGIIQAKKNAEFWIWGSGIGNIGRRLAGTDTANPLDMFYGDALFAAITGIQRGSRAGRKHDRDSGIDEATAEESRRKIPRSSEEQIGRGDEGDGDEGLFMQGDEDADVEVPRDAPSALDDAALFSAMPWNITASIRASSTIARSGLPGALSSAVAGRAGRPGTASPLHGRGQAGGLEALQRLEGEDEFGALTHEDLGLPVAGPGASSLGTWPAPAAFPLPQSQTAPLQTHPRVLEALDAEGANFLAFVNDGIEEKRRRVSEGLREGSDVLQADAAGSIDEVTFEELLPPERNSRVVAAQAMMHVLGLATKGVLTVRADEWVEFGEIGLSIPGREGERRERGEEREHEEGEDEDGDGEAEAEAENDDAAEGVEEAGEADDDEEEDEAEYENDGDYEE